MAAVIACTVSYAVTAETTENAAKETTAKKQKKNVTYNEKGEIIFNIDTEEFLWWLNNVAIDSDVKAVIVKRHTLFVPEYPTAEF